MSKTSLELEILPQITLMLARHETEWGTCFSGDLRHHEHLHRSLGFSVINPTDLRIHSAAQGYQAIWFGNTCIDLPEAQVAQVAEFFGIPMPGKVEATTLVRDSGDVS
ncbi:hypothetical protein [Dyella sp.]|uniref:hypothetical protein n=1 Tax=Dyella sp. TaxID=1869338 RepID=UPI002FDB4373